MGDSYAAAISKNAPQSGAGLLRARVNQGDRTSQYLAEWLKDFSLLQSKQAGETERFLNKHVLPEESLGTLAEPWQKIVLILIEQSRLTSESARRTQLEAEKSLRELLKSHRSQADQIIRQNESRDGSLPAESIESIQRLDETRLNGAKSALARFTTIEVDRAQAMTKVTERAMQAWLSFNPADDISAFIAQIVSGVAPLDPGSSAGPGAVGTSAASASAQSAPASRQTSQASSSTVHRKSSFLGNFKSSSNDEGTKSPGGGLRSKVGSIFGRKNKNKNASGSGSGNTGLSTTNESTDSSGNSRSAPGLGQRKHSELSVRSHSSSMASSLRQPRIRETTTEDSITPLTPTRLHGTNSPRRSQSPSRSTQPARTSSPLRPEVDANPFPHPVSSPTFSSAPATSTDMSASGGPFTVPVLGTAPQLQLPHQLQTPLFQQQQQQQPSQTSIEQSLYGNTTNTNQGSAPNTYSSHGSVPAPPPARHSIYRQGSLNRSASSASARGQRSNSYTGRESRVGSQVFADLPPTNTAEYGDTVAPLPEIPATPQHGYGHSIGNLGGASANGSPEQFYTPAQKFVPQFEHANTSVASITNQRSTNYPPLPAAGEGLVASAVEHVYAKYVGDDLVDSSVTGEAVAQIRGSVPLEGNQDHIVLGILLADSNAQLTPSGFLRQTSSLSFEVPYSAYLAQQELVQYHSDTAIGRVPIRITPQWRFDNKTVRLVLSFQLSELYVGGDNVEISDLVIAVTLGSATPGSLSPRAQSAQSKPVATFSREKQRVTWRFNAPQVLSRNGPATKLLCQFVTDGPVTTPGTIELKAKTPRVSNSLLQLRTLSASGEWIAVPTAVSSDLHQLSGNS